MRKSNLLFSLALVCAALLSTAPLYAAVKLETLPYDESGWIDPYNLKYQYYPQEIYGKQKLDSVVVKYSNGDYISCEFDAEGNVTKYDEFSQGGHSQVFYSYDADGNCTALIKMINPYSGQWQEVQKEEYTYDAKGRTTRTISSVLVAGTWKPQYKTEDTFDAHDNNTNYTAYEYQEDLKSWKTTYMWKDDYTYNANGQITKDVTSSWTTDDGWVKISMYEYEYDDKGRETSQLRSDWISSSWVNNYKTTTAYSIPDEGIFYVLINTEIWNKSTNKWEVNQLDGYTYYENGPWYYHSVAIYTNSSWTPYSVTNRTYDSDGKLLSDVTEYQSDHSTESTEYSYDDNGNKIAVIYSESGTTKYTCRWYYSAATGIDEVFTDRPAQPAHKVLRNGMLLIERNGKTYNPQGVEVSEAR